ncbi:hypothetical protein Afil01_28840 [Actinorhabdospora filicis]|uniref:Uncharacterized protein n=1 Tax=Actinorhabdospora filicis TaxID=1785913 RepID=A0A9W6SLP0_9ACTN|nr:hypothetical protein [Actinorhabdospora filicis]GLZ78077.1 hypothetical protein Afil01_28840 [Actinorhabdospora filicis]
MKQHHLPVYRYVEREGEKVLTGMCACTGPWPCPDARPEPRVIRRVAMTGSAR